ncbi:2-keto-3-deoxygluconate permease [Caprobacter fermentans]|uniref:2-keto-3-deoxygluconate permease n=1 Tax=Caproicibacter fermentans TaxID=2576756 RepID=A0A6N8I3F3_9FIRM|nr:2-keto-3-deoxygluconate permease [Caproicibacter fermentans]MVB12479.1 2-keto-3-deoxygluconate permease [Caproicibacter fermentans]OCN01500.1 2-keto-3-deoxygluconate permease [Clostridium sp. W14A]QNK40567.1 2-keto-3-deoxygluconate permease [Caproicibacter fermentans]
MKILKTVQKVPGGLMIVPMLLGVLVNTFVPGFLTIGSFTTDLWKNGAMPILAVFLFCNGAQIDLKQAGQPLAKGMILTVVKVGLGAVIGVLVNRLCGPAGVIGIVPLAVVSSLANSNGGLYAALAGEFGDAGDVGAVSILSLNDGPFFTMVAFGLTGLAQIPIMVLVGAVLPIVVGLILGNLDPELRKWLAPATTVTIPFFAFPLGAALNLGQLVQAGLPGIVLGVACTAITGFGGYLAMKLIKSKHPQVGAAIGTSAGNSVATPAALAATDATLKTAAAMATVQVAAAVIVTAILCPLLVSWLDKVEKRKQSPDSFPKSAANEGSV